MSVSPADVAVELGRSTTLNDATASQWSSWITRADRLIRERVGDAAYGDLDPFLLDDVILQAVVEHVRAWRDTTATRSTTTIDDGTISREYDKPVGLLEIPDALWPTLIPAMGATLPGAYSVQLGSPWMPL